MSIAHSQLKSLASNVQDLISVTVEKWDANLKHIPVDHSEPADQPEAVLRARVVAA